MSFVVTDACIGCRYTQCVGVCPVNCFHAGPNMLVIDPEACIDCALCAPECPVQAIVSEEDLEDAGRTFRELNAALSSQWPVIDSIVDALPDAEYWKGRSGKLAELRR